MAVRCGRVEPVSGNDCLATKAVVAPSRVAFASVLEEGAPAHEPNKQLADCRASIRPQRPSDALASSSLDSPGCR